MIMRNETIMLKYKTTNEKKVRQMKWDEIVLLAWIYIVKTTPPTA